MSYQNGLNFLESKTKVLELSNDFGARIAVCPFWNGRVMTSTCNGLGGDSYGLIDVRGIENIVDNANDNTNRTFPCGGENQFTLSPDRGRFSICHTTNIKDDDYYLHDLHQNGLDFPMGYTEGPFDVDFGLSDGILRMRRSFSATNISGAKFDLNAVRKIRLLNESHLLDIFSNNAFVALEHPEVSYVAYETSDTLVNSGAAFSQYSGLVSIRVKNMFNASPFSAMIVPFRNGNEDELGPPIQSDFFGISSRYRLHLLSNAALLRADGLLRGQIGVSRHRTLSYCAAINFRSGVLSIIAFNLPDDPVACRYMSNDFFESGNDSGEVPDFLSTRERFLKFVSEQENSLRRSLNYTSNLPINSAADSTKKPGKATLLSQLTKERQESDPYSGEVIRAYNHGPVLRNREEIIFPYFEMDTFSPAKELRKGESITHTQYTVHICADTDTLNYLIRSILNLDMEQIYDAAVRW